MVGALGWSREEAMQATLRELLICYQSKLMHEWDHTARIDADIHNLTALVERVHLPENKKPSLNWTTPLERHPYRDSTPEKKETGITPQNFGVMRDIWKAMARSKRR